MSVTMSVSPVLEDVSSMGEVDIGDDIPRGVRGIIAVRLPDRIPTFYVIFVTWGTYVDRLDTRNNGKSTAYNGYLWSNRRWRTLITRTGS